MKTIYYVAFCNGVEIGRGSLCVEKRAQNSTISWKIGKIYGGRSAGITWEFQ